MQLMTDVGLSDEADANTTAAALSALSALTRNLPVSHTKVLQPGEEATGAQLDPVTLLFALCDRFWPTHSMQEHFGDCRACRQIVSRSLGLLSNLASNSQDFHAAMLANAKAAQAWTGVHFSNTAACRVEGPVCASRECLKSNAATMLLIALHLLPSSHVAVSSPDATDTPHYMTCSHVAVQQYVARSLWTHRTWQTAILPCCKPY